MVQIEESARKKKVETISPEEKHKLLANIKASYESQLSPYYAAARLWIDGIIDPLETRQLISRGIAAADQSPVTSSFNPGILQTYGWRLRSRRFGEKTLNIECKSLSLRYAGHFFVALAG